MAKLVIVVIIVRIVIKVIIGFRVRFEPVLGSALGKRCTTVEKPQSRNDTANPRRRHC